MNLELLTFALIDSLRANTGRPIGDADVPRLSSGEIAEIPWAIVYPLEGGSRWGPAWSEWQADMRVPFQVTSTGEDRRQAQAMADRVRGVITGRASGAYTYAIANPAGMAITDRSSQDTVPGVDREGIYWTVPETFYLTVTPAPIPSFLLLEASGTLLTEAGDRLVLEAP